MKHVNLKRAFSNKDKKNTSHERSGWYFSVTGIFQNDAVTPA
jgi:hypothetical protein